MRGGRSNYDYTFQLNEEDMKPMQESWHFIFIEENKKGSKFLKRFFTKKKGGERDKRERETTKIQDPHAK